MNDNIIWKERARLSIAKMQDVLLARFIGRNEASKMDFSPAALNRLVTAISEITRNVVQHAGSSGVLQIGQIADAGRNGLRIIVSDEGRGMENPERFLAVGQAATVGSGLPGTRLLVDQFLIKSAPGTGTTVTMEFWKHEVRT